MSQWEGGGNTIPCNWKEIYRGYKLSATCVQHSVQPVLHCNYTRLEQTHVDLVYMGKSTLCVCLL